MLFGRVQKENEYQSIKCNSDFRQSEQCNEGNKVCEVGNKAGYLFSNECVHEHNNFPLSRYNVGENISEISRKFNY